MIQFTSENGKPVIVAEIKGFGVYLDDDSLIDFAHKVRLVTEAVC